MPASVQQKQWNVFKTNEREKTRNKHKKQVLVVKEKRKKQQEEMGKNYSPRKKQSFAEVFVTSTNKEVSKVIQ